MKKFLSIVLALTLFIGIMPTFSLAVNAATTGTYSGMSYSIENGEVTITDCDNSISGDVVIPSTIEGYHVTIIGDYAFQYCTNLTSITIPDSVTSIGSGAFMDCLNLTLITIPDSVMSIGNNAFNNTAYYNNKYNWENDVLYIGNYLIKAKTSVSGNYSIKARTKLISNGAFLGCSNLTSITIPDSVTSIGYSALTTNFVSFEVDPENTAYLSVDGVLFNKNKTQLVQYPMGKSDTTYTIPDSVTSIGDSAFSECDNLTSIIIPDSVTSIDSGAFSMCYKLTSITIPNSVTSIGYSAFLYCSNLTSIIIPDSVTSIGKHAFLYCSNLTSITIPDSVTTIEAEMFLGCSNLTSITIPDSVTSIGYGAFSGCSNLTSITIPDSVTSIGYSAFSECDNLTSITIPDSVTSIGSGAFGNCTSLNSVICSQNSYAHQYCIENGLNYKFVNLSKQNSQISLKFVDQFGDPVTNAKVYLGDSDYNYTPDYTANSKGIVTIPITKKTNLDQEITVLSTEHDNYTGKLSDFSLYKQNEIVLSKDVQIIDAMKFSYPSVEVKGPEIEFLGAEFPLFKVEAGIDFSKIPGINELAAFNLENLKKTNYVQIDGEKKTMKIMLGFSDGYKFDSTKEWNENYQYIKNYHKRYKENASYRDVLSEYHKIKDKLQKFDATAAFKCTGTAAGFIELDFSTGKWIIKESGLVFTVDASVSKDVPMGTWFYATFKLGGNVESSFTFEKEDSGLYSNKLDFTAALKPSLGIGAKIISKRIASAEVGLEGEIKGKVKTPAATLEEALKITAKLNAYIRMNLLFLEAKTSTDWPGIELYPNFGDAVPALLSLDEVVEENGFTPVSRDYLNYKTSLLELVDSYETLSEYNIYPYAFPKMVTLDDGRIVAFWVKDDGTKDDYNRTSLYYSVFENNAWTIPTAVYETGMGDFAPQVTTDGESVYVIWQRSSKVADENSTLEDMMANTQLVFSKWQDGLFSEPIVIDDTNGLFELAYSIAHENGVSLISWVENSQNDYTINTGTNAIYTRTIIDGVLGDITVLNNNTNDIANIASGFYNNEPTVAYSKGTNDGNYEIYFNNTQITSDDIDDLAISYQDGKFYWLKDSDVVYYENDTVNSIGVSTLDSDFKVLSQGENECVVFRTDDGFKNELYACYNIDGTYTSPVMLSELGGHISHYDVAFKDGNIMSLMAVDNLNEDESVADPYTTKDMVCEEYLGRVDVEIGDYVAYDDSNVKVGQTVTFTTEVTNTGTVAVDTYTLTASNSNGDVLCENTVTNTLLPGATGEISVEYIVPEDFVMTDITFTLSTQGEEDVLDNSITVTLGKTDIEVSTCYVADGHIKGTVTNNGFNTATNVTANINVYDGENTLIETFGIPDLQAGESYTFDCDITENITEYTTYYELDKFAVSVSAAEDESNYVNNECDVISSPIRVTSITLNKESVQLHTGETVTLTATIQPLGALEQGVIWLSDATDIATVDENGLVFTHKSGTATITAISVDGDFVAECVVKVGDFSYPEDNPIYMYAFTQSGDVKITEYIGENSKIEIPENFDKYKVTEIGENTFAGNTTLTQVILPKTVTAIGANAFNGCTSLTDIVIPESVTEIDVTAFSDCESITVKCKENSTAHTFCEENSVAYELYTFIITVQGEILTAEFDKNQKLILPDMYSSEESGYLYKIISWIDENGDSVDTDTLTAESMVSLKAVVIELPITDEQLTADLTPINDPDLVEGNKFINGFYVQGAQIRIPSEDGKITLGLRFINVIDNELVTALKNNNEVTSISYGTVIISANKYTGGLIDLDYKGVTNVSGEKIFKKASNFDDRYFKYTACIIGIPQEQFETTLVMRPYLTFIYKGNEITLYGEQYSTAGLYSVAEFAVSPESTETEEYKAWINENIIKSLQKGDNDTEVEF